jgi:hypothetical protein
VVTALVARFSFLRRLLVGVAVAALAATAFSVFVDGRPWSERFGVACVVVGCVVLVTALVNHSPGMRLGLPYQYLASFFPDLARRLGESYPTTRVSESALFDARGATLLALGFA